MKLKLRLEHANINAICQHLKVLLHSCCTKGESDTPASMKLRVNMPTRWKPSGDFCQRCSWPRTLIVVLWLWSTFWVHIDSQDTAADKKHSWSYPNFGFWSCQWTQTKRCSHCFAQCLNILLCFENGCEPNTIHLETVCVLRTDILSANNLLWCFSKQADCI